MNKLFLNQILSIRLKKKVDNDMLVIALILHNALEKNLQKIRFFSKYVHILQYNVH